MVEASNTSSMVTVRVELFGSARMACGNRYFEIELPERSRIRDLTAKLIENCPELSGKVVSEDGTSLLESYTLNLNGTEFVIDDELHLREGDSLLLFSSQAGG